MNEAQVVSLIALLGWLILVVGAYRAHQVNMAKTIRLALIWACIFAGLTFFFTLVA